MDLPDPDVLDRLADRGWPALEREALGPWTLRAADGVTSRANSALALGEDRDIREAVDAAERWYASRGLPAVFQLSSAAPPALAPELERRGYRRHSATDILVADRATVVSTPAARDAAGDIAVATSPTSGWLDTWWAVDGRGGDAERRTVERILAGGPALYAWAGRAEQPDAVARLALVGGWGGLYAVATLPSARRRGLARALTAALAREAAAHGVDRLWLQVVADNSAAIALYESLGFVPASRYEYWEEPPQAG